jgi:YggT family protein
VDAIRYLVNALLWLLMLAFMLRLLLQLVRANFRDPLADAIVRVTNWLVLPLRRVLPPIGRFDTATVVAILCAAALRSAALFALAGAAFGNPGVLLRFTALGLVDMVLRIYLVALLLYWLTSTIASGAYAPGMHLLERLCEPVLRPVRRLIPPIGRVDFSFLWLSIGIGAALALLR